MPCSKTGLPDVRSVPHAVLQQSTKRRFGDDDDDFNPSYNS